MFDAIIIGGMNIDFSGRPLGPYRLRTALQNVGYTAKIIDYASTLSNEQFLKLLSVFISDRTRVVGFSVSWFDNKKQFNLWANHTFFETLKEKYPHIKIVIGGTKQIATMELIKYADWFLTGFSDISFVKLLDHLIKGHPTPKYTKNQSVKTIDSDTHYKVENMDELETVFLCEDDFFSYQPLPIELGRGCIFKCAFCTHPFLGKKNYEYIRSSENLAKELKRNYELFGTTRYYFADDTFNDSIEKIDRVKRAIDLAKLPNFEFVGYIKPELLVTTPTMIQMLKDCGLKGAHFGIESMNPYARKMMGKGMDVNRIFDVANKINSEGSFKIHASFICGLPKDSHEDFYNWQDFLVKNRDNLFRSWRFLPLSLNKPVDNKSYSTIEKDPSTFGYDISDRPGLFWNWSNEHTNFQNVILISDNLNNQAQKYIKPAGWYVGNCWFHNVNTFDIENKTIREIDLLNIAKANHYLRVKRQFEKNNITLESNNGI